MPALLLAMHIKCRPGVFLADEPTSKAAWLLALHLKKSSGILPANLSSVLWVNPWQTLPIFLEGWY